MSENADKNKKKKPDKKVNEYYDDDSTRIWFEESAHE